MHACRRCQEAVSLFLLRFNVGLPVVYENTVSPPLCTREDSAVKTHSSIPRSDKSGTLLTSPLVLQCRLSGSAITMVATTHIINTQDTKITLPVRMVNTGSVIHAPNVRHLIGVAMICGDMKGINTAAKGAYSSLARIASGSSSSAHSNDINETRAATLGLNHHLQATSPQPTEKTAFWLAVT